MNKLLVICGPTATGKTSLGILLAKKFNGELVSADSRQVYQGMDIGTGKELPLNSKLEITDNGLGYYQIGGIRIWGYDLVDPKEEFSVSEYVHFAKKVLKDIRERKKLPIVVGGTGFYIKSVTNEISTIDFPRNEELRDKLSNKSPDELFDTLSTIDPLKAGSLNSSDSKNPRRLIRAIEVAQYSLDNHSAIYKSVVETKNDVLFIGLKAPEKFLKEKIDIRVEQRIKEGFEKEVKMLIDSGVKWGDQSMFSLGYRQWKDYYEGKIDRTSAISEWKKEERKYAKRQMTWFRKDKRINWFDVATHSYKKKVENMIKKWHNNRV